MPTAATTSARRANDEATRAAESSWDLGLDVTREAQEAWGRSLQASFSTMTTFLEVTQRINRELFDSALGGAKQSMKLWADMVQGTAERGSERIKDAVETMADQVKENTGQLASVVDENGSRAARSTTSRAS